MTELFGDERGRARKNDRQKNRILPRCGSCSKRVPTMTLPISGLRRCQACFEEIRRSADEARWDRLGFCEWPRVTHGASAFIAPQPELEGTRAVPESQPFASAGRLAKDWGKHFNNGSRISPPNRVSRGRHDE